MPYKPLTPCRYPGCPELTSESYCPKHKKLVNAEYDVRLRDKGAREFYRSKTWQRLRQNYLIDNPFCVCCFEKGKLVRATVVDHVVPIRQGGSALDEKNLQALCSSCHGAKSIREGSRYGSVNYS